MTHSRVAPVAECPSLSQPVDSTQESIPNPIQAFSHSKHIEIGPRTAWTGTRADLTALFEPHSLILIGLDPHSEERARAARLGIAFFQLEKSTTTTAAAASTGGHEIDSRMRPSEKQLMLAIPSEEYSLREVEAFINLMNGYGTSTRKKITEQEQIHVVLLAHFFAMRIKRLEP
jgi:hypothetical protein